MCQSRHFERAQFTSGVSKVPNPEVSEIIRSPRRRGRAGADAETGNGNGHSGQRLVVIVIFVTIAATIVMLVTVTGGALIHDHRRRLR